MTLDDWKSAAKKVTLFELCQKSSVPRDPGSLLDTTLHEVLSTARLELTKRQESFLFFSMDTLIGKAGKRLFEKHLEQYAPPDPLYESYMNDRGQTKRRKVFNLFSPLRASLV